jgi:D-alanyl-D-alanine-carboxypeptidase/D-alanyl-D-alanine-endopeptidase
MNAASFRRALSLVIAAVVLTAVCEAAAIELPDGIRETIEQGIANGRYQSVVVGLIDHEDRGDWQFGAIAPDGTKPISADVYEIGSSTRTFTGLLLAQALLAGKLRLDTSLKSVFGEVRFADPRLASVTIGQIAAHRAGLPSIPSNLFPRNVDDPYVEYDAAALLAYLAHAHLDKDVGAYRYSDLGVALLGEAIARVYKKDYRNLLATEVLAPLALTQSGFGAVPRLLDGYYDGQPVAHWQYQTLSAASGLRASLSDLMRFTAAQLRPDASSLRAGILLAREPRAVAGGGETALAWQIVPVASDGQNWPLLWQAGITGGFASFIGLRTDRQRAIVLLGNAGVDLSALGLTLLADRQAPSPPPKRLPMIAPASLAYEGWYRFDTGGDLVVRSTADGLVAQVSGLLPQRMSNYDDDAFELAGETSQLTFQRDQTRIVGATLHFNGKHLRAQRLSEGAPTLRRNTSASRADELAAYAGDYALSPSVRAHIAVATPGLRAQLTGTTPIFIQLCAVDRFCDADGTLEIGFTQEGKAKATALDWRQGVFESRATRDDW